MTAAVAAAVLALVLVVVAAAVGLRGWAALFPALVGIGVLRCAVQPAFAAAERADDVLLFVLRARVLEEAFQVACLRLAAGAPDVADPVGYCRAGPLFETRTRRSQVYEVRITGPARAGVDLLDEVRTATHRFRRLGATVEVRYGPEANRQVVTMPPDLVDAPFDPRDHNASTVLSLAAELRGEPDVLAELVRLEREHPRYPGGRKRVLDGIEEIAGEGMLPGARIQER